MNIHPPDSDREIKISNVVHDNKMLQQKLEEANNEIEKMRQLLEAMTDLT